MAEQDKDYQLIFQKPILALMKKSKRPEIRHWKEEADIKLQEQ